MRLVRSLSVGLSIALLAACSQSTVEPSSNDPTAPGPASANQEPSPYYVAYPMAQVSKEQLNARFLASGLTARQGIRIFRLIYPSKDLKGTEIRASGILVLPDIAPTTLPWISLQHVTITGEAQAPSNKPEEGLYEASQGFAVVVADQIVFGSAKGKVHPYLFPNAYPTVLIDGLRAARAVIEAQGHETGPLFLRGYSEGAYATLALQRALEQNHADEFPIRASAPAAGPYELEQTAVQALSLPQVNPVNVSLIILSYVSYLAPEINLGNIFAGNVEDIKQSLDGRLTYEEALKVLPSQPATLFKPQFLAGFTANTPTGEEAIKLRNLLGKNSLFKDSWVPASPTRFYHCADDEVVPSTLTEYAIARIRATQAMAPVASEIAPPNPSQPYRHGSCPLYYASVAWFTSILAPVAAIGSR
jgi:hypothetical protein